MSKPLLKPKGVYWRDLSESERIEIQSQIKNITIDPALYEYRFYRTQFNKWIIPNAMAVPLQTKKAVWV